MSLPEKPIKLVPVPFGELLDNDAEGLTHPGCRAEPEISIDMRTLLDRAIQIAVQAHAGQTDWSGHPYILHPMRIMLKMDNITEKIIAILHDVVEDTKVTLSNLEAEGFPKHILDAVEALTRIEGEDYTIYVERVAGNYLARKIKLADLEDNMNPKRFHGVFDEKAARLMTRYVKAFKRLGG